MLVRILIYSVIASVFGIINAQSIHHVTHLDGVETINGISVTVTHQGKIAILEDLSYCDGETGPYYFGYSYLDGISKNGSYTFTFDPPVKEITVNVTGLSADGDNMEEVKFFINEEHYSIPTAGNKIDCEQMAILTTNGNIRPCRGCSVSGWKGTKIDGPITTFTVSDIVMNGDPAGALIALFIGDPDISAINYASTIKMKYGDVAAGKGIIITCNSSESATLTLTNKLNEKLDFYFEILDGQRIFISSNGFDKGAYELEIKSGNATEKHKIVVE